MSEAEQLLREVLEHGDIVGWDEAGRAVIQMAIDSWTLERLFAFGTDAVEREDGTDDDEPDEVPPVHACWLDEAA